MTLIDVLVSLGIIHTHPYVCVSGVKKVNYSEKFRVRTLHGWSLNVNFGHSVQWSGDLIVDLDFYWQFSQNNATLMHLYMNFKVICEITFLIKKFALQKHSKNVLLAKLKRWILFLGQTSCDFIWFSNQKILLYHQNTK